MRLQHNPKPIYVKQLASLFPAFSSDQSGLLADRTCKKDLMIKGGCKQKANSHQFASAA